MTKEEYQSIGSKALGERLVGRLRAAGRRPCLIPVGGSSGLGSWAYLDAVREIQAQQGDGRPFTDVAVVRSCCGRLALCAGGLALCFPDTLSAFDITHWLPSLFRVTSTFLNCVFRV